MNKKITEIETILNDIINNNEEHKDVESHNIIHKIEGITFILGNICGIAFYRTDNELEKYICVLLSEHDDYWSIYDNSGFDSYWLRDHKRVIHTTQVLIDNDNVE